MTNPADHITPPAIAAQASSTPAALAAARQLLIEKTARLQATRVPAPAMNQAAARSGNCGGAAVSDSKSDALRSNESQ